MPDDQTLLQRLHEGLTVIAGEDVTKGGLL